MNAQSIVKKIEELAVLANDTNPDLILITESWCHGEITNAYLTLPGYDLQTDLRLDREDTARGAGGGLLVYVKNGLTVLPDDKVSNFCQHCNFKLVTGHEELKFTLLYRSPNAPAETIIELAGLISKVERNSIILGDFNLPGIDWQSGTAAGHGSISVKEACDDTFLEQLVGFPTHVKGNTLDLLLTNIPERVLDIESIGRLGSSDHMILKIQVAIGKPKEKSDTRIPNWRKADWHSIKNKLRQANLREQISGMDSETSWKLITGTISGAINDHVPTRQKKASNRPVWMTQEVLRAIRRKRNMWRRENSGVISEEYKAEEKKVKNLVRNAKRNHEKRLARENGGNSKPFYAYLKGKTKSRTLVGPLKNSD